MKRQIEEVASAAGLATRTARDATGEYDMLTRVACEELEAWFLGDPYALRAAYPRLSARLAQSAACRDPDLVAGGTWEKLERILQRAGYFPSGLAKLDLARTVAPLMDVDNNTSNSFRQFRDAVRDLVRPSS